MDTGTGGRAVITGASRGLGLALARALAHQGWRLVLDARGGEALRDVARELTAVTTVSPVIGDIADREHRRALRQESERLGGLELIVANAGILGPSPLPNLLDLPLEDLEEILRVNVVAQLGIVQELFDLLTPGAAVIAITSDAAVEAYPGWGGYGTSKAALEQLWSVLAAENPAHRIYRVDPGDMRTEMHQAAFPGENIDDRPLPEESVPAIVSLISGHLPSGRYRAGSAIAIPAEVAA